MNYTQRYVDLLSDSGFKAVFGDENNKDIVKSFLNIVLKGEHVVKDIEFGKTELPGLTETSRGVRFDLICQDVDGTKFVVEMQRARNEEDFFHRSVYYGSMVYTSQLKKGAKSYLVNSVYVIGVMEGRLKHRSGSNRDVIARYQMVDLITFDVAPSTINCTFVQLGNFKLSEKQCTSDFDRWCYTLKNVVKLSERPASFEEDYDELYHACEIAHFNRDKRLIYDFEHMTELEYEMRLNGARSEGRAEGRAEQAISIAKTMIAKGFSDKEVSELTGISLSDIQELRK